MGKKNMVKDLKSNYQAYLMILPAIILLLIFSYIPMYGIIIAFKDYRPKLGFFGSPWVGLEHFKSFYESVFFWRLIRNTVLLSVYSLLFGFPLSILLALLINEVKSKAFKRTVQTVSYMPYFISTVVICGMIKAYLAEDGFITQVIASIAGRSPGNLLGDPKNFRTIFVVSDLWQNIGWNSIIYLAALTGIDPELYESAWIDGAGRLRQLWHITLPGIRPTIVILLILCIGNLLSINDTKILLLYTPMTYETADVIGTYVYRRGLIGLDYSFATAIGLMNTVINLLLLLFANWFSRATTEQSLW